MRLSDYGLLRSARVSEGSSSKYESLEGKAKNAINGFDALLSFLTISFLGYLLVDSETMRKLFFGNGTVLDIVGLILYLFSFRVLWFAFMGLVKEHTHR